MSRFPRVVDYKVPETVDIVDAAKSRKDYADLCLGPNVSDVVFREGRRGANIMDYIRQCWPM
eukprot:8331141-Karenia_brevis.AAC.1